MASTIKVDKIEGSTGSTVTVPTGQTLTVTDGLAIGSIPTITVAKGGTNTTSYTTGDTVYASGATAISKLGIGTARQGLQTNSGASAPEWVDSPQSLMTAAGDVLYASGANTLAKLAKGSDTEVLTLASGVPSWAAPAGGGAWTLIETQTGDDVATELEFTTLSTDYRDFRLIGSAVVPGTDGQDIHFQIRSATAWVTSGYTYAMSGSDEDSTVRTSGSGSANQLLLNHTALGNNGGENIYFEVTIADVHSTSNQKTLSFESSYPGWANKYEQMRGGGRRESTVAAVDGVRIKFGAGTIKSGTITLYGRKNT